MERRDQEITNQEITNRFLRFLRYLVLLILPLLIVSCNENNPPSANIADNVMYEVNFVEQEKGVAPYPVRMLFTKEFLRIDEGEKSDGYILYDRNQRQIISVSIEEKRVYKMPKAETQDVAKPENLKYKQAKIEDGNVPEISGIKPIQYDFYADSRVCFQTMSAQGLLPEVVQVLKEYEQVLSRQQVKQYKENPAEFKNGCDLVTHVFYSNDYLEYGFPVVKWDSEGYRRMYQQHRELNQWDDALFTIPKDYRVLDLSEPIVLGQ